MSCPKCGEVYTMVEVGTRFIRSGEKVRPESYQAGHCPTCGYSWDEEKKT